MDEATIEWSSIIPYSNVKDSVNNSLDENGFYIILVGKRKSPNEYVDIKLQYIGQAYEQTIRERVLQPHPSADVKINKYLSDNREYVKLVKSGIITESSQERITQSFFDDIEACLISKNNPPANDQNKNGYKGRDIIVKNIGKCAQLEAKSECKNNNRN